MEELRQMLLIRKDLNMTRGKEIAQGAHGSMKAYLENKDDPRIAQWLSGKFTKIAVSVESEEQLLDIYNRAKEAGIIATLITDAGLTMFNGVPTNTVVALGPDTKENLDPFTGNLKLR